MAEAILAHQDTLNSGKGKERFIALSAGIIPKARPESIMLDLLQANNISAVNLTPKSLYPLFESQLSIFVDVIITLSEEAKQLCPVWPGHPTVINWQLTDPLDSSSIDNVITKTQRCFFTLQDRISILTSGSKATSPMNLAFQLRSLASVM